MTNSAIPAWSSGSTRGPGQPLVMGILNVTPDSFSDGGLHMDPEAALRRGRAMAAAGADFIDVGGESTRPGATPVRESEEQRRVIPVIELLRDDPALANTRISVDTRNESTARAAVAVGADLINDVSASLWPVAAETGVGWVAMHMAGDPRTMQTQTRYDDVVSEVRLFLDACASMAERAGVSEVWVDPGLGFGKSTAHNVALLAHLDDLVADGRPVMVGTSAKRTQGVLLARSDAGAALRGGFPAAPAILALRGRSTQDRASPGRPGSTSRNPPRWTTASKVRLRRQSGP